MEHGANIGSSLRAERERLGLSLARAEADTRIRTRYLAALEEERFDVLPGEAYVRGFLRCYATYLGLDGAAYLAAYRERVRTPEPAIAPARQVPARVRVPGHALVAALTALGALALGAWKLDDRRAEETATPPTPPHPESVLAAPAPAPQPAAAPAPAARPAPRPASPAPSVLVLTTRGGSCWLDVRIGGPQGTRAWRGTLEEGRTMRFGLGKALFIRAGAAHNLQASIGGVPQRLQPGVADLVATRQGLRPRE